MTLSKTKQKYLDSLMAKQWDLELEILYKLETVIDAKWNAPKIQAEIEKDFKKRTKILEKACPLQVKSMEKKDKK